MQLCLIANYDVVSILKRSFTKHYRFIVDIK
jgi:hypothetical protein